MAASTRLVVLLAALALAEVGAEQLISFGVPDQETSLPLTGLTVRLAGALASLRCEAVLTHPYEGGHPDHDGVAFAVHAACRLLTRRGGRPPAILEFTSYYAGPEGGLAVGEFLPADRVAEVVVALSEGERTWRCTASCCGRAGGDGAEACRSW